MKVSGAENKLKNNPDYYSILSKSFKETYN